MDLSIAGLEDVVEIGRGGFATVYRAYQPAFRRTVAVKVLNAGDVDESAQERFRRECQAMGLLSEHPNIVTVLDAGFLDSGRAYMVMPFMPAGSLADKVRRDGPLPWAEASRVAVKLAGALHAAHDSGVIHRDVKPANVLVSEYGETKLADFGIARVSGGSETRSGVVTASLAYAPPEVIEGKRPTVRSDIYSLGATIYDLAAGHPPFQVAAETSVAAILNRILNEDPEDLVSRGVPAAFAEVIAMAMAKDPDHRFDTAAAFGRHVRLVQDELGIRPTELTILKVQTQASAARSAVDPEAATAAGTDTGRAQPETVG
ncbi:MAG: serine/threonine-protein kinase, partial [Acidimicrobiales bacterium]